VQDRESCRTPPLSRQTCKPIKWRFRAVEVLSGRVRREQNSSSGQIIPLVTIGCNSHNCTLVCRRDICVTCTYSRLRIYRSRIYRIITYNGRTFWSGLLYDHTIPSGYIVLSHISDENLDPDASDITEFTVPPLYTSILPNIYLINTSLWNALIVFIIQIYLYCGTWRFGAGRCGRFGAGRFGAGRCGRFCATLLFFIEWGLYMSVNNQSFAKRLFYCII
jgi:hypothetical protein